MDSEKIIPFNQIDLPFIESGKYEVEKHRIFLSKIRIGSAVADEFHRFCAGILRAEQGKVSGIFVDDGMVITLLGAKVQYCTWEHPTFYMRPDEILFLSECDDIYARARKNNVQ